MELELPAYRRIRVTLSVIDVYLVISGALDVVIGCIISRDDVTSGRIPDATVNHTSSLWIAGLPLLIPGLFGLFTVYKSTNFWTVIWVIVSIATNCAVFLYISVSHQVDPETIGVNLGVYGKCEENDNTRCLCKLPRERLFGILYTTCENVRWKTTMFLVLVIVFIIGLATLIIALFLALTLSFWLPHCANKRDTDTRMCSSRTSFYGPETTCINDVTMIEPMATVSRQPLLHDGASEAHAQI